MKVEFGDRRSGKTTKLAQIALADAGAVVLCATQHEADRLVREYGLPSRQVRAMHDHRAVVGLRPTRWLVDDYDRLEELLWRFERAVKLRQVDPFQVAVDVVGFYREEIKAARLKPGDHGGVLLEVDLHGTDWEPDFELEWNEVVKPEIVGDLRPYTDAIGRQVRTLAQKTGVPPHYLTGD